MTHFYKGYKSLYHLFSIGIGTASENFFFFYKTKIFHKGYLYKTHRGDLLKNVLGHFKRSVEIMLRKNKIEQK
jgi:hypothetical protein